MRLSRERKLKDDRLMWFTFQTFNIKSKMEVSIRINFAWEECWFHFGFFYIAFGIQSETPF